MDHMRVYDQIIVQNVGVIHICENSRVICKTLNETMVTYQQEEPVTVICINYHRNV